jgi:hypothetical protein
MATPEINYGRKAAAVGEIPHPYLRIILTNKLIEVKSHSQGAPDILGFVDASDGRDAHTALVGQGVPKGNYGEECAQFNLWGAQQVRYFRGSSLPHSFDW